jgi:hypothetical protein
MAPARTLLAAKYKSFKFDLMSPPLNLWDIPFSPRCRVKKRLRMVPSKQPGDALGGVIALLT